MRKILFKGFAPNNDGKQIIALNGKDYRGDWVEGFVLKLTETRWAITDYYPVNPHSGAFANKRFNTGDMIIKLYEIIPQTLCQFTGIKDRNGTEIWEGDIVRYPCGAEYEIFYDDEMMSFRLKNGTDIHSLEIESNFELEVIGNIHDKEEEQ